ncbi:MAG TPA: chromate resistance protein ChrB domain-containing protein [Noviherbaspirillum sp.]|nr:chromate resistance protein ChrB domain-containing protein [Noviherbaspirillum sp.]
MTKQQQPAWHLLIVSVPTSGATLRMRLWRSVKSLGCASLRDGAYLLPDINNHSEALTELAEQTNAEGGQAWVVDVVPRSFEDHEAFRALFSRKEGYASLAGQLTQARKELGIQSPAETAKTLKRLRKERDAIRHIDFFPDEASLAAEAAWDDFEDAVKAALVADEPQAEERPIPQLRIADYQERTWATRRNLWVDRVASAWLIRSFIDPHARFLWLDSPSACPEDALGFDFDNAAFTHIGDRVTFEVLLASFGLDSDPGLVRLGALVHALDVGGPVPAEASGFEAIMAGARARLADDDALLAEIGSVLDSLHFHFNKERSQ